jgi:hypothetical protein
VVEVQPVDWDEIDAGSADVENGCNAEIDIELLDLGGAMKLVVGIEADTSMFKLDLGVQNNIVVELI